MKTLFVNTSPKKKWSNSGYLMNMAHLFAKGTTVSLHFSGAKDYPLLFEHLKTADALVLAMPLYVDAIPSHVLLLLQELERFVKENNLKFKVYVICNCGFYEGEQCELEIEMIQCWCSRCGLEFAGGRGIGAGEMVGALLLNIPIAAGILVIEALVGLAVLLGTGTFSFVSWLNFISPIGAAITLLVWIVFSLSPWMAAAKIGIAASCGKFCGTKYTTVSFCPRFLFVFFASIYWVLRALVMHRVAVWRLFSFPSKTKS